MKKLYENINIYNIKKSENVKLITVLIVLKMYKYA